MSANRDFDDIARAWLDLMPDEAPDRVIADVLLAVETVPQARRPLGLATWRLNPMKNYLAALGAAAVVVAAAAAFALSRPTDSRPVGASPAVAPSLAASSTAAVTPSPAASGEAAIPTAIQHVWLGGHDDLLAAGTGAALVVGPGSFAVAAANNIQFPVLTAAAVAAAAGQLELTTAGQSARCDAGQVGTYAWTLSPSGRALTLRVVSDPCTQRSVTLATTWLLVACQEPTDNCLGPIDAGTYVSQFMNFQHPAAGWTPNIGAITYTVPEAWANYGDWPDHFGLTPMSAFPDANSANGPGTEIDITADVHAESAATPCSGKPASVGTTPGQIVASLRTIPGLVVGRASSITIDGKTGQSVDLTVDPANLRPCGSDQVVEYLVGHKTTSGLFSGSAARLLLIPVGSSTVSIEIIAPSSDFDAFVASAMPIVNSLKVH